VGDSQAQSESASRGFSRGRGRDQPSGALIFAADTHPQIDHRLSDLDQLTATFKQLEITRELPLRPGYGTLGKEVVLRSNFFPVEMQKRTIYDYDVSITPTNGVKGKKSRIFYLLERIPSFVQHVNHIAHDGSERMVSAQELPQPLSIEVPFYEDGESGPANDATVYTVSITFARQLDTSDLTKWVSSRSLLS
jgi:eukaryotic translation initiation factor 2C